uniref:Uncharacterized protein n=1 Tax=Panagrolaimus sp. PS1159 TaxID=55785 RepID=A0AC35GR97_9BILA
MWFLWILMIIFIILPSHQTDTRSNNPYGDLFLNDVQNFAFHTKINGDKYVITSLSGSAIKEEVNDDKQRVDKFDKEFPIRAFHIAYPSRNPIKFEMEIEKKYRLNCFRQDENFQLPCICYDDNLPPEDIDNRFNFPKNDVIYYCGTQQSMICFDPFRGPTVVSSNPTIIKSPDEFEDNSKTFYSNIGTFFGNSRPVKFTFTIYNNNSAHVSTSDGQHPAPFKVKGFNFTEGYIDQD